MLALQRRFVERVVAEAPDNWELVTLHYELFAQEGVTYEHYKANVVVSGERIEFDPSLDAIAMLTELQSVMPADSSGVWTWLLFSLQRSGEFEFKYGTPPLAKEAIARER